MIETMNKILKFKESIKEVNPILISGFANFYGAEFLEEIENKISNIPIALKLEEEFINNIIVELKFNELIKYFKNNITDKELLAYINATILKRSVNDNKLHIKYFEKLKYSDDLYDIKTYNEYSNLKKEFTRIQNNYQEIENIVNNHLKAIKVIREKYNIEYQNKVKDILLNHTNIPVDKIMNKLLGIILRHIRLV